MDEKPQLVRTMSIARARRRARAANAPLKTALPRDCNGGSINNLSNNGSRRSSVVSAFGNDYKTGEYRRQSSSQNDYKYVHTRANSSWMTRHIKRKECVRHVENPAEPELCHCGRMENQHYIMSTVFEEGEDLSGSEVGEEETEEIWKCAATGCIPWSRKKNIKEFPTNAFGEVSFTNTSYLKNPKPAKYARISDSTRSETIIELMVKQWRLSKPDIVISIHGGLKNFKLDPHHKEIFNRGLIRAAKTTSNGAWIITGGTNLGVMRAVGQAVNEGQSMQWGNTSGSVQGHPSIKCIGVATWGYVERNQYLINMQEGQGCNPATYRVESTFQRGKPVSLNPDHTHFLLVDDGTEGQCGTKELKLRARLERAIAQTPDVQKNRFGLGVPVVVVVLEGGIDALTAVHESILCGMPALVVEGTGRTADVLAFAYSNCDTQDGRRQVKRDLMPKLIAKIKEANPRKYDKPEDQPELMRVVGMVNDCMKEKRLITVYKMNEKERLDLDLAILSALLKSSDVSKYDQLKLALTWNRVDIAENKIFTADSDWPAGSLDPLMLHALKFGRVDFVRLFLANGVSMWDFLTVPRLRELYNTAEDGSHLYSLLSNVAVTPEGPYTLSDISQLIEQLVGGYNEPLYRQDRHVSGIFHDQAVALFNAMRDRDGVTLEPASKVGNGSMAGSPAHFERPFRELFLWAVLMNRFDLAVFMWEKEDEDVSDALAACRLFRAIHDRVDDEFFEMKKDLIQHADEFESMAMGVMDECYNEDEVLAEMLVEREFDVWGHVSALNLAAKAHAQNFLAHPCCQSCLNNIWKSRGMPGVEAWQVILTLLIPLLLLTRTTQFYDEDKHSWKVSLGGKIKIFYTAPITKFWGHLIMYVIFLCLYAYVILYSIDKAGPSVYEMALLGWIFTMILDEIRQVLMTDACTLRGKLSQHFAPFVNMVDCVMICLAIAALVMRFFDVTFEAARVLYCVDFAIFALRLLRMYTVSGYLGPKIFMIWRMLRDLLMWLCLLVVFIISFGVLRRALLYGNKYKSPNAEVLHHIFHQPYWNIYGELFFDDKPGPDGPIHTGLHIVWIDRILMTGYLLITNVLLINLLIAIFSNVFNEVEANAFQIWKYQAYFLVMEYHKQSPVAPPFVIITILIETCTWMVGKCCRGYKVTPQFTIEDIEILKLFEIECTENFLRRREEQLRTCTDARIRKMDDRVETLVKQVSSLQDQLYRQVNLLTDSYR